MKSPQAFTLIEVVLALAVISTALLSIVGLMSVGFGMLSRSIDLTTEAQIVQSINAEITMTDYSALTNGGAFQSSFPRSYDDEGQRLQASNGSIYTVTAQSLPSQLPGVSANLTSSQREIIRIARTLNPADNRSYSIWVVNNGQ